MKRFELAIALLLVPIDFLMLFSAAITAYFLRFEGIVTRYRPVIFELDFTTYLQNVIPLIIIWLLIFAATGLYTIRHPRKILTEVKKIFAACSLGFAVITILIFLRGELFNSRFIVLAGSVLAIVFVAIARIVVRFVKFYFYKKGIGMRRVILVGNDKNTVAVQKFIKENHRHGLQVVKRLHTADKESIEALRGNLKHADLILLAALDVGKHDAENLLDFAREHGLEFHYVADLFNTKAANTDVSTLGDVPIIEIKQTPLEGWGRIYKRIFDLVIGAILLILALPFMLIVAIAIKLDSKGPVIYKNQRVGKNGRLFNLYKFRRLKSDFCTGDEYDKTGKAAELEKELIKKQSHREGPLYKISDDPCSTRVGRFLEKTSLDELPQFFNVLIGNVSLVGPRPHQPREVELYKKYQRRVLTIKPGVTGLSQISGRSDLDFDEEVRLDMFYIENWSIRGDIAIILKTPFALIKKRKYS